MQKGYRVTLGILTIMILVTITIGTSYSYYSISDAQENPNTFNTACFGVLMEEQTSSMNIVTYPMSDAKGLALSPFTFNVKNKAGCETSFNYQVIVNVKNTTASELIPYMKYTLDGTTVGTLSDDKKLTELPTGATTDTDNTASYVLASGTLSGSDFNTYNLRFWIAENGGNSLMGKQFAAEVIVYAVPAT